jgi:glycerol transport system ATP-binding protein
MANVIFRELAHSYQPDAPQPEYALHRMNLTWEHGKAYALLGPSGCGKTTLLNLISGLLTPSEGAVWFDERDVTQLPTKERNIAQVFQFPVIYDTMTVRENLAFPLRNRKIPNQEIERVVTEVAEILELSSHLNRKASGLSADQKQKISMGRGLVRSDVSAILLDEALTVIDPHQKWVLRRKLKEIHRRYDHTMVYVTHDQTEAMTFADEVVVMQDGRVLQMGTPQELFERPAHTFIGYFIGSPGMNLLPCHFEGNHVRVDNQQLPLTRQALDPTGVDAKLDLQIGVRPEFLRFAESGGVPVQLLKVEEMGQFQIATAKLGEHEVKVKVPEDAHIPANPQLVFPANETLLYANGALIERQTARRAA